MLGKRIAQGGRNSSPLQPPAANAMIAQAIACIISEWHG